MGQNESTIAGATGFALPPSKPSPIKEKLNLESASDEVKKELKDIADTLEKRKCGL